MRSHDAPTPERKAYSNGPVSVPVSYFYLVRSQRSQRMFCPFWSDVRYACSSIFRPTDVLSTSFALSHQPQRYMHIYPIILLITLRFQHAYNIDCAQPIMPSQEIESTVFSFLL